MATTVIPIAYDWYSIDIKDTNKNNNKNRKRKEKDKDKEKDKEKDKDKGRREGNCHSRPLSPNVRMSPSGYKKYTIGSYKVQFRNGMFLSRPASFLILHAFKLERCCSRKWD